MNVMPKKTETAAGLAYDVAAIRADFPILAREVYGKPLVYLDNGASAQKPRVVLDTIQRTYDSEYANVHRGLHYLSNTATARFEEARETVRRFLNAPSTDEIIFTRNATEAINLVASSYGGMTIGEGDEIVLSIMEHHSNIVPWHFHRERNGAVLKWAPIADDGTFLLDEFEKLLTQPHQDRRADAHVERARHRRADQGGDPPGARPRHPRAGRRQPGRRAHAGRRAVDLDCDFYVFTGHKTYGPTGIGVLYAKKAHLDAMPPYMGGGEMIESVLDGRHHLRQDPAQVRGRHALHRAGHRAGRRARLHDAHRPRPHRSPRARAEGLRARPPRPAQLAENPWPGQG